MTSTTILTTPADRIAKRHPLWKKDIRTFGPLKQMHRQHVFPARLDSGRCSSAEKTKSTPAILICDQCGSSMDSAWGLLTAREIHTWDSVIVTEQTAGRGQFRRNWVSPAGNLYASWVWPPLSGSNHSTAYQENLIPLVAAYIVAHSLELLGVDVRIKWPNDLLYKTRKIGGILVEQQDRKIIVGIGINVASAPRLPPAGTETVMAATCLAQEGFDLSPLKAWCHLVESGIHCFEMLIRQLKVSEFINLITDRLAWRGKHVHILENGKDVCPAIVMGVAEDGGLLVKKNARTQIIHSGKILTVE
jgi:BirA family biotin operon repressor/biotin-[acetyl-CoA-carboxylase] ligase